MAHFINPRTGVPLQKVRLGIASSTEVALWGGGPAGEKLNVSADNPLVAFVRAIPGSAGAHTHLFRVTGLLPGSTTLNARLGSGAPYAAPVPVEVGIPESLETFYFFYHGTVLARAKELLSEEIGVYSVPASRALDWWEYTDFGKGFYCHVHQHREMSVEWAKKKARQEHTDWGVTRFAISESERNAIPGNGLYFRDKKSRPGNAPVLFDGRPASWLEFVEFNRGLRTEAQRPKDNDWTGTYPWMHGPFWTKEDSGKMLSDRMIIPDHIHQHNWGQAGLKALNAAAAKKRRFLFDKTNEDQL
ncbi:MAG TPA: hypothetical protein VGD36_05875 [Xanthobacteraceae bacterium]